MNPFAFRPVQVTIWLAVVYLALLIPLIVINETVPPPPSNPTYWPGLNLSEAWLDLATLSAGHHPFNSRQNEVVRNWLLLRVQDILNQNNASWKTDESGNPPQPNEHAHELSASDEHGQGTDHDVVVFNDLVSNVTAGVAGILNSPGIGTYFEGNNIIVYIRGSLDEDGEWWKAGTSLGQGPIGKGGVLINAHYDSVSSGFGATDAGMGVITVLQTIKYFTTPGHRPKRGIIALFNNGEEDFLYGSRAFGNSPVMPFVHTFLNLEGAGAGGRPILLRTTDQQVTSAFSNVKDPYGTVIGSDAFGLGFIRSQTDYVVFNGVYGARGLDLSFFRPRARYHTDQDDLKHTNKGSLWNMITSSISTMINLSSDTGDAFVGERADGDKSKVQNGRGSDGVWFDLFAKGFVLFNLRGMFAWSLTILITTPLILVLVSVLLHRQDKYYFFTSKVKPSEEIDGAESTAQHISIGGFKGLFRFPLALVFAGALNFGLAFLVTKVNPLIIYSSEYSVWASTLSLFFFSFWCIMRGADFTRPSALHRGYAYIWLFVLGWIILVAVTVLEDRYRIASGYAFVFFQSQAFLATLITLVELFALPKRRSYALEAEEDDQVRDHLQEVPNADALIAPSPGENSAIAREDDRDEEGEPATETTPLVGRTNGDNRRTTFATTYRRSITALANVSKQTHEQDADKTGPYGDEQPWSGNLPTWTWLVQFLVFGPFSIILFSQLGLVLTYAIAQTGSDGSSLLVPHLLVAFMSIFILIPVTPYIHRVTHHIPLFLLVIFIGTLVYNLVAFPFSESSRYKTYWLQSVNLDTGYSTVGFVGIEEFVRPIIAEIPSASGKPVTCAPSPGNRFLGLTQCSYDASDMAPSVADDLTPGIPPSKGLQDLVSINTTAGIAPGQAVFEINAKNTRACFINFKKPIKKFFVDGANPWDDRFGSVPEHGLNSIKLWRRDWTKTWKVVVEWDVNSDAGAVEESENEDRTEASEPGDLRIRADGLEGNVTCVWSDANTPGTIPAFDEATKYAPVWVAVTKAAEGLVEGSKSFII